MENLLLLTIVAGSSLVGVGLGAVVIHLLLALTGRMIRAEAVPPVDPR